MLNKDEEHRLAACIDMAKAAVVDAPHSCEGDLTNLSQLWLAEKLKETNDELKLAEATVANCEEWHQNNR